MVVAISWRCRLHKSQAIPSFGGYIVLAIFKLRRLYGNSHFIAPATVWFLPYSRFAETRSVIATYKLRQLPFKNQSQDSAATQSK